MCAPQMPSTNPVCQFPLVSAHIKPAQEYSATIL